MKPYTDQEFAAVVDECAAEVEEMIRKPKVPETVTVVKRPCWVRRVMVLF